MVAAWPRAAIEVQERRSASDRTRITKAAMLVPTRAVALTFSKPLTKISVEMTLGHAGQCCCVTVANMIDSFLVRRKENPVQAQHLSISRMADAYGVTLRTLRFYEDRGLLQPVRVGTGRFYTARDRIRLELILKGKRLGFSLTEIERLLAPSEQAPDDVVDEAPDIARRLDRARIAEQLKVLEGRRDHVVHALAELRGALANGVG